MKRPEDKRIDQTTYKSGEDHRTGDKAKIEIAI